jgi:hypothetical protein
MSQDGAEKGAGSCGRNNPVPRVFGSRGDAQEGHPTPARAEYPDPPLSPGGGFALLEPLSQRVRRLLRLLKPAEELLAPVCVPVAWLRV